MTQHSRNLYGLCLAGALLAAAQSFAVPAEKDATLPEADFYKPPLTLRDAQGNPEVGLIDPFSRTQSAATITAKDGSPLMRTSLGEMSEGFKILAIAVPEGGKNPAALIQVDSVSEPTLVHEGDLVRIERDDGKSRRGRRPPVQRSAQLQNVLDRYTFYIYVKRITATGLEVYYNKKRPDDTIILRW